MRLDTLLPVRFCHGAKATEGLAWKEEGRPIWRSRVSGNDKCDEDGFGSTGFSLCQRPIQAQTRRQAQK